MKQFKYILSIILSVIAIIIPIASAIGGVYFYMEYEKSWMLAASAAGFVIGIFLVAITREFRVDCRMDSQTNEYGENERTQYKYLSQQERNKVDLIKTATRENLVSSVALKKMTKQGPKDPIKALDELIGLDETKEIILEMVARMKFEKEENKRRGSKNKAQLSGRHMVFFGSPGTGKTSVARIITSFLYEYGYIKENKCIEIDGNFLKAGSDSALKTELVLRAAFGGVLFIDEAYALVDSIDKSGEQVIATLIKHMEDNRDKFILILAGYTNEMKHLIATNPGFESRLKEFLYFPDYSDEQMHDILRLMAKNQNFSVDKESFGAFDKIIARERTLPSFGNGRTVRNILDKAIDKHSLNLVRGVIDERDRHVLRKVDFENLKIGNISTRIDGL